MSQDPKDRRELTAEELEDQEAAELPDREAMSLINANVAAPINAAVAANVGEDSAIQGASSRQYAPIHQDGEHANPSKASKEESTSWPTTASRSRKG